TVESCQRSAQRMRRLIESLLELARLDAGQEPPRRMRFNLSQLVRDCVSFLEPMATERSVAVHCEFESIECAGDSDRIMQVVTNLLTNAIQYNRPNGEVRISVESREGTVTLKVSDTGQGISPADLPHIFDRFYRADPARSTAGMHSGLGLAIAKA